MNIIARLPQQDTGAIFKSDPGNWPHGSSTVCVHGTTPHHRLSPRGSYCPSPSFALPHLRTHAHTHITSLVRTDEHTRIVSIVTSVVCVLHCATSSNMSPSHQSSVWYEIIYPTMQSVWVTRWAVSCYSILSAAASECAESQNARGLPSNSESTFTGLSMFWPGCIMFSMFRPGSTMFWPGCTMFWPGCTMFSMFWPGSTIFWPGSTMFCKTSIQLHAYNCTYAHKEFLLVPTSFLRIPFETNVNC